MAPMKRGPAQFVQNRIFRAFLTLARGLPYAKRVPFMGWVMAHLVAPMAGWRKRIRGNLALIYPDLPKREVDRLCLLVPDNLGRAIMEVYSPAEFANGLKTASLQGAGVAALAEAKAANRPVICVTGHFGNYTAACTALIARDYRIRTLYNPMSNGYFNDHYVEMLTKMGMPMIERSRSGMADLIRFLKQGGMAGIPLDQHIRQGEPLDFLGHPAYTALSAAELALKYDALVVPVYGLRKADGLSFDIIVEKPIPHSDPVTMTQAMNDSLAQLVERFPEQWLWIHRRWKPVNDGP